MIKRKEIEEVTRLLHEGACIYQDGSYPCPEVKDCAVCYLKFLDSRGVVIRVDRGLPAKVVGDIHEIAVGYTYLFEDYGLRIITVEPLIKGV